MKRPEPTQSWEDLASVQEGAISRQQLLAAGWSARQVQNRLERRAWQRLLPGVYATFTGPVPRRTQVWAALLYAGRRAAIGGRTALWLCGVERESGEIIDVVVPADRRVQGQPGVRITVSRRLGQTVHPVALPRRLRLEEAVLDVAATSGAQALVGLALRVVQQRQTTPERLLDALGNRARHPHRALLEGLLARAEDGVRSPLEDLWLRSVHRAHGLPPVVLNSADVEADGTRRYRDARFVGLPLVVELDGLEAHPRHEAFRDRRRDNRLVVAGTPTLRYGWAEVGVEPCAVAAETVRVLVSLGWTGVAHGCRPGCPVTPGDDGRS